MEFCGNFCDTISTFPVGLGFLIKQRQQLGKVVDEDVSTGSAEVVCRGITMGDSTSLGASSCSHENINGHVADNESLSSRDTASAERQQNRLGVGFSMPDIIGSKNKRDAVDDLHLREKFP